MPRCRVCNAETPVSHYDRTVYNLTPLYGPWDGWRMAGRFLVAPGKAGRIIPERLLGMLWQERASQSLRKLSTPELLAQRGDRDRVVELISKFRNSPGDDAA